MAHAFARPSATALEPGSSDPAADEMLIARIARGDQLALRSLFARHRTRVYRFIMRLIRDESAAEDVLSEVFFEVWRSASRFEGRSSLSTWLLAIARFKVLTAMRRRRDDTEPVREDVAARIPDTSADPQRLLERDDDRQCMQQALAKLSPAHAEVIDLVYYHGRSVRDVAQILAISESTVKTRMFYARKKLSELLGRGRSAD